MGIAHSNALSYIIKFVLLIAFEYRHDVRHVIAVHRVEVSRTDHGNHAANRIECSFVLEVGKRG